MNIIREVGQKPRPPHHTLTI